MRELKDYLIARIEEINNITVLELIRDLITSIT